MKQVKYTWAVVLSFSLFFISCDVDTLKEAKEIDQVVSLVQIGNGNFSIKADNIIIDKENRTFRKGFGVALSGFEANQGFSVDLVLDYVNIPEGTVPMTASQCFLTAEETTVDAITHLDVPASTQQKVFYLNITEDALLSNMGKVLGVKLQMKNLDNYKSNDLDSVNITLNTQEFTSKKIDVTYDYFLNTTFARDPAEPNERFDNLDSWIANDAVVNSRTAGAGYDNNAGYMGIERWGSYDNPIINGKIYQTFTMPAGRYSVEVQLRKIDPDRDTYFVVAQGSGLPDDAEISTAIEAVELTVSHAEKLLPVEFFLPGRMEVSTGFLINIDTGVQKILQASNIKLYRLETFFD